MKRVTRGGLVVRRPVLALVLLVTLLALTIVMVGCGGSDDTTSSTVAITSSTTTSEAAVTSEATTVSSETPTTEAATTTTTEPLSSAEILLPNGHIQGMGYIDKVWEIEGTRYLSIDYAQMLGGEEARQAAIAAGEIGPNDDLPNDYFIVNDNPKKREFKVDSSVEIATATSGDQVMENPIAWPEFRTFWSDTPPAGEEHLKQVPWEIERDGANVVRISEIYLP